MRWLGVLVCCGALGWCGVAEAARPGERVAPDGLPTMSNTTKEAVVVTRLWDWAQQQWPAHTSYRGLPICDSVAGVDYWSDGGALAMVDQCRIMLPADGQGIPACIVLVHEDGHVFGREHTTSGVMAPSPMVYAPCNAWFDYTAADAPTRRLRALIYTGWDRGACRPLHHGMLCRRHGTETAYVAMSRGGYPTSYERLS